MQPDFTLKCFILHRWTVISNRSCIVCVNDTPNYWFYRYKKPRADIQLDNWDLSSLNPSNGSSLLNSKPSFLQIQYHACIERNGCLHRQLGRVREDAELQEIVFAQSFYLAFWYRLHKVRILTPNASVTRLTLSYWSCHTSCQIKRGWHSYVVESARERAFASWVGCDLDYILHLRLSNFTVRISRELTHHRNTLRQLTHLESLDANHNLPMRIFSRNQAWFYNGCEIVIHVELRCINDWCSSTQAELKESDGAWEFCKSKLWFL